MHEFRRELNSSSRHPRWREQGVALSALLFSKLPALRSRPRFIAILPDGPLWLLPFEMIPAPASLRPDKPGELLTDLAPLAYLPSVTVWRRVRRMNREMRSTARLLLLSDPNVPGTADEVRAVRSAFAGAEIVTPAGDSSDEICRLAADCDYIHIACHAIATLDGGGPGWRSCRHARLRWAGSPREKAS